MPWSPDLVASFAGAVEHNPWGPLETAEELLGGSYAWVIEQGRQRAIMAVRPVPLSGGIRLDVAGLVSEGPYFHERAMDRALQRIALEMGCDLLAMTSQRPHLVKACQRQGWQTTGALLTKWVRPQ